MLDRRGEWRIRVGAEETASFERIGNAALREFIARNYVSDERGRWYFQNGPQRVFVRLAYTPRVWRLDGERLIDQCGQAAQAPLEAWLDEEGSLLVADQRGIGVLDDRDLGRAAEQIIAEKISIGAMEARLGTIVGGEIAERFGFQREPRP